MRKSSHTTYDVKLHLIWCTKYRYRVMTGEIARRAIELIRETCSIYYVEILSGNMSPDHAHMLVSVPPSLSISKLMQYAKGRSSRKLMQEFASIRKRYWGQHIWGRGYFVTSVGELNEQQVQTYIETQEQHHGNADNFSISPH